MTHRSRLCAVLFDVEAKDFGRATDFWAAALQREIKLDSGGRYAGLPGEVDVLVQSAIPGREGMHVDIETDDVDAEVARLEKLQSKTWPEGSVEWE